MHYHRILVSALFAGILSIVTNFISKKYFILLLLGTRDDHEKNGGLID